MNTMPAPLVKAIERWEETYLNECLPIYHWEKLMIKLWEVWVKHSHGKYYLWQFPEWLKGELK